MIHLKSRPVEASSPAVRSLSEASKMISPASPGRVSFLASRPGSTGAGSKDLNGSNVAKSNSVELLRVELDHMRAERDREATKAQRLEQDKEMLVEALQTANKQRAAAREEIAAEWRERWQASTAELERLRARNDDMAREEVVAEQRAAEHRRLLTRLEALQEKLEHTESQLRAAETVTSDVKRAKAAVEVELERERRNDPSPAFEERLSAAAREMSTLHASLAQSAKTCDTLSDQLREAQRRCATLKDEQQDLQRRVGSHEARIRELEGELDATRGRLASTEKATTERIRLLEESAAKSTSVMEETRHKLNVSEERLRTTQRDAKRCERELEMQLSARTSDVEGLTRQAEHLKARVASLEEAVDAAEAKSQKERHLRESLDAVLCRERVVAADNASSLEQARDEVRRLEDDMGTLFAEFTSKQQECADAFDELDRLQASLSTAQGRADMYQRTSQLLAEAERQLSELKASTAALETRVQSLAPLEARVRMQSDDIDTKTAVINDLRTGADLAQRQIAEQSETIVRQAARVRTLEGRVAAEEAQRREWQSRHDTLESIQKSHDIIRLQGQVDSIHAKAADADAHRQQLQQTSLSQSKELQSALGTIRELEKELERTKQMLLQTEHALRSAENERDAAQELLTRAKESHLAPHIVESERQTAKQTLDRLENLLRSERATVGELRAQVSRHDDVETQLLQEKELTKQLRSEISLRDSAADLPTIPSSVGASSRRRLLTMSPTMESEPEPDRYAPVALPSPTVSALSPSQSSRYVSPRLSRAPPCEPGLSSPTRAGPNPPQGLVASFQSPSTRRSGVADAMEGMEGEIRALRDKNIRDRGARDARIEALSDSLSAAVQEMQELRQATSRTASPRRATLASPRRTPTGRPPTTPKRTKSAPKTTTTTTVSIIASPPRSHHHHSLSPERSGHAHAASRRPLSPRRNDDPSRSPAASAREGLSPIVDPTSMSDEQLFAELEAAKLRMRKVVERERFKATPVKGSAATPARGSNGTPTRPRFH